MSEPEPGFSTGLPAAVHQDELVTIANRRRSAFGSAAADCSVPAGGEPTTRRGLVGLAISGGGIRSSTFSLGIIQTLVGRGLFKWFDYMSTVSGGGYTGSLLSSVLRDGSDAEAPLVKVSGDEESTALKHLRNGSNYLSPGGVDQAARLPAVVIRGLILNALQVLPALMLAVIVTEWIHESRYAALEWLAGWTDRAAAVATQMPGPTEWVILAVIVPFVIYRLLSLPSEGTWERRDAAEKAFGWVLLAGAAAIVALPLVTATGWAIQYPYVELERFVAGYLHVHVWIVVLGVGASAVALIRASKQLSSVFGRAMLYGAAVLGPALVLGAYLLLVIAQVDSPFVPGDYAALDPPSSTAGARSVELSPPLREALARKGLRYRAPGGSEEAATVTVPAIWCGPGTVAGGAWHLAPPADVGSAPSPEVCGREHREVERVSAEGPGGMVRIVPRGGAYEVWGARLHLGGPPSEHALMSDGLFAWLAVSLLVFNLLFLDVNMSSLHAFYRDRLSRLYLFRVTPEGDVEPNDDQKLSELNGPDSRVPYHIINATLNMQGDPVESARGRASDFFFFSKHHCGGPHAGYCRTSALEAIDSHVNLGTAMAISAAAAAPNMGATTKKGLVFILTVLNFRLGYWLPSPRAVNAHPPGRGRGLRLRPGVLRLLDEAMGSLRSDTQLVNVSDGGHLENLALYELLRRRCRLIVAIDGEADPGLTFQGLTTLMRIARIDLGIKIEVDLGGLKWSPDGLTDAHYAIGEIDYGDDGKGLLVYVKSSVDGNESPYVAKYRAENPDFPHETTADQFFDEVQFEAYRALGEHVGLEVADGFERCLGELRLAS